MRSRSFPDGRAIIKGTTDTGRGRAGLYARFVGKFEILLEARQNLSPYFWLTGLVDGRGPSSLPLLFGRKTTWSDQQIGVPKPGVYSGRTEDQQHGNCEKKKKSCIVPSVKLANTYNEKILRAASTHLAAESPGAH